MHNFLRILRSFYRGTAQGSETLGVIHCFQGDLLFACFGGHGDNPKVVMAASDIEVRFRPFVPRLQEPDIVLDGFSQERLKGFDGGF